MEVTVTEQAESHLKLDVSVAAEELAKSLDRSARRLGSELKVPGFRKGKVPAPVVIKRLGREAVLEQALRDSLGEWYEQAILRAGVEPVGDPDLKFDELPPEGAPLRFSIEIGVRPKAELGDYIGLEVGRREPEIPAEAIDAEIERLREGFGRLETVDREARVGDFAVVDFTGTLDGELVKGGDARDHLIELGAKEMVGDFEEQLIGAKAGEAREFDIDFPGDYGGKEIAGKRVHFAVQVKAVQEKHLPTPDDDFAAEAAGFDTIAELRDDIESKLRAAQQASIEAEFHEATIDSAVREAKVRIPPELAEARAAEMWHSFRHRLEHQGIDPDQYMKVSGKDEREMLEELVPRAEQSLKRESVLEAVADAEQIEVSDEDLLESIRRVEGRRPEGGDAEAAERRAAQILAEMKASGRDLAVRRDLRIGKAADFLAEHAQPITIEQAQAREKLWTPERGAADAREAEQGEAAQPAGPQRIWTPGS